jgi:G:T-mismatch repair DNA endonuclease (very short patch repair protein)
MISPIYIEPISDIFYSSERSKQMTKMVRKFTKEDKLLLAVALLNAGIKARIKMLNLGARVVFDGSQEAVAEVLNSEGFLHPTAASSASSLSRAIKPSSAT